MGPEPDHHFQVSWSGSGRCGGGIASLRKGERARRGTAALFLSGGLLIGIAPGADLQTAANPAKTFSRVRRATGAADYALTSRPIFVGFESLFCRFGDLLVDYGLRRAIIPDDVAAVEGRAAARTFLPRPDARLPPIGDDVRLHVMRANDAIDAAFLHSRLNWLVPRWFHTSLLSLDWTRDFLKGWPPFVKVCEEAKVE